MAPPPRPLRDVDFYRRDDGELGIAYVSTGDRYMDAVSPDNTPGAINLQPVDEYLEVHFGKGKKAEQEVARFYDQLGFVRPEDAPWPLPKEPAVALKEWEAQSDAGSLLADLSAFFGDHVRFPSDVFPTTAAVWTLRSAVPETASHAPPLTFLGPPRTGKSRAIRALRLVVRRGMYLGAPSPASLYALSDQFQPTLLIDEWTKLAPDIRRAVETILRMGFEKGGYIPRRREHADGVKFWRAFCFYGIASLDPLPDDLMDRGIPAIMAEAHDVPDLPLESEPALDLRTAVLRYRLEVLGSRCHRTPSNDGRALVLGELKTRPGRCLSDRGLDKAQTLAAVAAPFDAVADVLDAIMAAEEEGRKSYADTTEAMVFRAITALAKDAVTIDGAPQISLFDIHNEIWRDLQDNAGYTQRQLEMHDPVLPERLGPMVRRMGFATVRKKAGMVVRDPDLPKKLRALAWKYGGDEGAEEQERGGA